MARKKRLLKRLVKPARDKSVDELTKAIESFDTAELYHNSYLSRSTIARLRSGKTRMPQNMTMRGIAEAAGFEYVLRKKGS